MAFSKSVTESSDVIHDYTCTPCSEDGLNNEAINYCVECASCLCATCVQHHGKLLKSHTVLDEAAMKSRVTVPKQQKHLAKMLPTDICKDHPGKVIEMYCGQHDTICCTVCIAVNHRNCRGINYIPNIAKGILAGRKKTNTVSRLDKKRKELQEMKIRRQEELASLKQDEEETISKILGFKERVLAKHEQMEEKSVNDVRERYKDIVNQIEDKICSLDVVLKTVDRNLKDIEQCKDDSEAQLFVHVKHGQTIEGKARSVLQEEVYFKNVIKYDFNETVSSFVDGIDSLGTCTDGRVLVAEYDVRMNDDRDDCIIYDACVLDDGQIVVSDFNNFKIKRLDTNYRVTDACSLNGSPWGICKTSSSEIAVALSRSVQFVTMGAAMSPTRSFWVGVPCLGISYYKAEIFVTCFSERCSLCHEVKVYDMSGSRKRSFETYKAGYCMFTYPQYITISSGGRLYVSDRTNGLILLDRQGGKLHQCLDKRLTDAMGSCFLNGQQLIVCGNRSNNVVIVDREGKVVKELLGQTDGINKPTSVLYFPASKRLLVSMENSNKIKLFDCSKLV